MASLVQALQCLVDDCLRTVPECKASVEQLSRVNTVELQVRVVLDEGLDDGLQLAQWRIAQVVGGLEVVAEGRFLERLEEPLVLPGLADEGFVLASEVLELVLQLLQLQVDPLDHLDLDELFVVVAVAGADEEDQLDVGLLGGVEGLPVFGPEAVLHRDDLGVLEAEHLRDDVLGLRRRVGDDGPSEEVFEVVD